MSKTSAIYIFNSSVKESQKRKDYANNVGSIECSMILRTPLWKRGMDVILATITLFFLAPFILIIYLSIKIVFLVSEEELKENSMVGSMVQGEDVMKQSLSQYMGKKEPLDCEIEMSDNPDNKFVKITLKKKKDYKKTYKLLNEMFFGDFFKKMLEAMMGAFGNMFGGD